MRLGYVKFEIHDVWSFGGWRSCLAMTQLVATTDLQRKMVKSGLGRRDYNEIYFLRC